MTDSQNAAVAAGGLFSAFIQLCGQGAPIASVGLYFAPMPTIKEITSAGTVGNMPLLPYSSMLSNAFLWTTYGLMKMEPTIWSCNSVGIFVAAYYCVQFAKNLPKHKGSSVLEISTPTLPGSVRQHLQAVSAVIVGALLLAIFKPFANTANLLGNVAVLFCVLMFASPLSVIKVVLETKSAKAIPLPFTVVSVLNCLMWTVFGWFEMKDVNVYLPNILGLISGLVQLALKIRFGDNDNLPIFATP